MADHWMKKAFKPGRKGAEHRALGVPEDKPIPPSKHRAALAGRFGPKVKKMEQLSHNANS
jgi:hypothetical protein